MFQWNILSCTAAAWGKLLIGPIPWGHSGPLCHALSLSAWTSHAACAIAIAGVRLATPGDWQCNGGSHLANGPNIFQMLLVVYTVIAINFIYNCANKKTIPVKKFFISAKVAPIWTELTEFVYRWVFTLHILQILLKQLILFNRYSSLNFKVQFLKWTCICSLKIHDQQLNFA